MIEVSKGEGGLLWYWVAILSFVSHFFLVYQYIISPVKVFFLGDSYYYL
ncbi:Uncharacterised protein [Yersinia enterocolitica]|nr:Uncharacterised protein [Yersinia enterocolitica]CQJ39513.1 Uncharacterised protein [Yersinia enterocolitica]